MLRSQLARLTSVIIIWRWHVNAKRPQSQSSSVPLESVTQNSAKMHQHTSFLHIKIPKIFKGGVAPSLLGEGVPLPHPTPQMPPYM